MALLNINYILWNNSELGWPVVAHRQYHVTFVCVMRENCLATVHRQVKSDFPFPPCAMFPSANLLLYLIYVWKMLFGAILFLFLLDEGTGKVDVTIEARSLGRNPAHGVSYANFKAHNNSYLAVTKVSYGSLLCTKPNLLVLSTGIKSDRTIFLTVLSVFQILI